MSINVETLENVLRLTTTLLVLVIVFKYLVWPTLRPKQRHEEAPNEETKKVAKMAGVEHQTRETIDGVCVGILREGRMLVVRTKRYSEYWQPVGGRREVGEDLTEAAVREVFEETGWRIEKKALEKVLVEPMDAHGGTLTFYTAQAPFGEPVIDETEIAEWRWVERGNLVDLPAFAAAQKFFALSTRVG